MIRTFAVTVRGTRPNGMIKTDVETVKARSKAAAKRIAVANFIRGGDVYVTVKAFEPHKIEGKED